MTNEEFQKLVLNKLEKLDQLEKVQHQLVEGQQQLVEGQQQLGKRQDQLEEGQRQLGKRQEQLEEGQREMKEALVRIEQEHGRKISGLFDAREVQFDVNRRIFDSLDRIEEKLEHLSARVVSHDLHLKSVK